MGLLSDWHFLTFVIPTALGFCLILGLSMGVADFDGHIEGDVDLDADGHDFLSVLGFGRTPFLLVLLLLLLLFGGTGIVLWLAKISPVFSIPIASAVAFFGTRVSSRFVGRHMPLLETKSVKPEDFIGQRATVTLASDKSGTIQVTLHKDLYQFRFRSEDAVARGTVVRIMGVDAEGIYEVCLEP